MITLEKELFNKVLSQCLREFPNEACGILAGKDGKVLKVFESANVDKSPSSYLMEPREQLSIMKEIRNSGLEMAGIYHSHVASEAYPSSRDIELAFYPEASLVIVSLKEKNNPRIRSFKIAGGRITEEDVKIE
jgi:[CysO sulfur-carrier protein]-S-L-cysteine hydrolase